MFSLNQVLQIVLPNVKIKKKSIFILSYFLCVSLLIIIIIILCFMSFSHQWSSLKSERQQVSLTFQNSTQYSSWSQLWCNLDGLNSFFDHQFSSVSLQALLDWLQLWFVSLPPSWSIFFRSKARSSFSLFFTLWFDGTGKSTSWQVLFFYKLKLGMVFYPGLDDSWVSFSGINSYLCIIFTLLQAMFFTPALAGGLSLWFEWQQVSSGLLDSSHYSSWS